MYQKIQIACSRFKFVNYYFQSLVTLDYGNALTYPVKYIDPGYKDQNGATSESTEEAKSTGFEVIT